MRKITFDTGLQEFEVNGGAILRFNPSDPNVYSRFYEAQDKIEALAAEYEQAQADRETDDVTRVRQALDSLRDIDCRVKKMLSEVFGAHNDFDAIFGGASMFSVGASEEYIITNLFAALQPIIEEGFEQQAKARTNAVLLNRAQRRALAKEKK
jgi:hypothetical protein